MVLGIPIYMHGASVGGLGMNSVVYSDCNLNCKVWEFIEGSGMNESKDQS